MTLKQRLFSNLFSRNMLADFGLRSSETVMKNGRPFFQYRIGDYQEDYYLYFPKEPLEIQYRNEIFNKIREYSGYEVSKYISFHFDAYEDKSEFLEFLKFETEQRAKLVTPKKLSSNLNLVQKWIEEKHKMIDSLEKSELLKDSIGEEDSFHLNHYNDRLDTIFANAEVKFEELNKSHNSGNIQLINTANYTKLIQLLIVLRDLQTAFRKGTTQDHLFKTFSSSDIASMLQQHFSHFQNKKINTVQKEITAVNNDMDYTQDSIKKLNKALIEFFFEK